MRTENGMSQITCMVSGKPRILNRKKAKQFAVRQQRIHGSEFGFYKCPHCHDWHLTTKRKKK